MPAVLEDLRAQREALVGEIEALTSTDDFDPTDDTFIAARNRAESLDGKIKSLVEWQSSRDAANAIDALQVRTKKSTEVAKREAENGLTPGQIFTRSRQYDDFKQTHRGTSGRVEVEGDLFFRAPLLTTTFPDLLQPQRIAAQQEPYLGTPLLNAIDRIPVESNSVEFVIYPALPSPEAKVVAEGAPKPETGIAPVLETVTLETIAYWLEMSRQFNEDAGALRAYIDNSLRRGIVEKCERLAGDELNTNANIPVTANTGDLLTGIRIAISTVQLAGYVPTAIALNPADYASLDIDIMGTTQRGPVVNGSVWGVGVLPLPGLDVGTAVVGNFQQGMAWLARNSVQLFETDSHSTNFIANLITLLAETRGKAVVHRPAALTRVSAGAALPLSAGAQSAKK